MRTAIGRLRPFLLVLLLGLGSLGTSGCVGHYGFIGMGTAIDILPNGFLTIVVGGSPYYYHRGIFYRPLRGGFVVVPAPIGAMVMGPPPGYVMVQVENDPYAYYRGVFYQPMGPRFVVVRPPVGAFVRRIPEGAVSRRLEGVEYKEYAGVWYRPAIQRGERGYQVAEPPEREP